MNTDIWQIQNTAKRNQQKHSFQAVQWLKCSTTMVMLVVLISNGQILHRKDETLAFFTMWFLVRATAAQLRMKGLRDLVPLPANDDSTRINCRLLTSPVGKRSLRQTQTWGIGSLVPHWTLWLRCCRLRFKTLISQLSTMQPTLPESSCLIYLETQCVVPLMQ